MNIEILEILMKRKKIPSYYQLSERSGLPYTTLLDLVHGKSMYLHNIKYLSNYFGVDFTLLLTPTEYYCVVTEDNQLEKHLLLDKMERLNIITSLLL